MTINRYALRLAMEWTRSPVQLAEWLGVPIEDVLAIAPKLATAANDERPRTKAPEYSLSDGPTISLQRKSA